MADDLRRFRTDDLAHLEIHKTTGDLYWRGRRLQHAGCSRADKLAFWAIIAAALITLVVNHGNLLQLWDALKALAS